MNKELSSYLSEIGKRGGAARSPAKRKASRRNGKKGGRPKNYQEMTALESMQQLAHGEDWKISFMNFVDGFRRRPNRSLLSQDPARICPNDRMYALLQSICLQLCLESGFRPKGWLLKKAFLQNPWFVSGMKSLYATALKESPIAFKKNNIFVMQNFLTRV